MMKKGIYPVVHTPLDENENLDLQGLKACLEYYNQSDIPGVTLLGSGGELPYLSDSEQYAVIESAYHYLNHNKVIIAGIHAHSSKQAIDKITSYTPYVDYVLLLLSDYYHSSFAEYLHALKQIAQHASKPILFYYFPQITGRFFSVKQLVAILDIDNIIGIKDSSLHIPTARSVLSRLPETLYFSGLSLALEPIIKMGAAGPICPIASVSPQQAQDYYNAIEYNFVGIKKCRDKLIDVLPIINSLQLAGNTQYWVLKLLTSFPVPLVKNVSSSHAKIKHALNVMGIPINTKVRTPLPSLTSEEAEQVTNIVNGLQAKQYRN